MTNTMMVVIVVSRRVGQVTLAVSERTSCKNLNGLKAIVGCPRPVLKTNLLFKETEQPSFAQPSCRRMSREAGSIVRGDFSRAAPDIRVSAGRQQVAAMYCGRGKRSRSHPREVDLGSVEINALTADAPVRDAFTDNGVLREDGRMVQSMFLFEVKKPEESKAPW